ncbi:GntR family transcriptional regulator [Aestuariispira insulae]|uniref:Regulatory GntR family protein n=1 Tax=Aestuariispira insulae TaxID=1461337 RepID=A0A3D9HSU3_9PROT|nr:GntR family transcriptional regulator [Aestuariispira insulae]RED52519.1 regulatory GntR family protein [Aestuariispira insulae]
MQGENSFKYEAAAARILDMLSSGLLGIGMKAPSLREFSRQSGIAMSTAMQAYRLLEDQGVLECRPKSGFYVRGLGEGGPDLPRPAGPPKIIDLIDKSGSIQNLLVHASDQKLLPLGCAIPTTEILASEKLDRCLARAARVGSTDFNLYTVPKGNPDLSQELARRALEWVQVVDPEDMAITCGATEAIYLALKCVTKPGDLVAVESPT